MSAAPTQIAVVQTASNLGTNSAQIQKDFLEEPLARQNSVGNRARGGLKGKHLTRSHAMRESTSPPRTPTPRLSTSPLATVATVQTNTISGCNNTQSGDNLNDSSISSIKSTTNYIQTGTSISPPIMIEQSPPHVIITTQNIQQSQQQQQNQNHSNVVIYTTNDLSPSNSGVICNDVDFPKLTPPKSSKGTRNMNNNNNNNNNVNRDLMAIDNKHNSTTGNDHKLSPSSLSSSSSLSSPPSTSSMVVVTTTMMTSATTPDTQQQQNYFNGNKKNNCIINVDKTTTTTTTAATINGNQQPTQNSNRVHSPSTNRNLSENFTTSTTTTSSSLHNNNNNNSNNNNNGNGGNINHINNSGNHSHINQSQQQLSSPPIITSYDKENRCPRNESQNSNNSGTYSQDENHNNNHNNNNNNNCLNENQIDNCGKSDRLGKKHRNGANSKGSKPRLKNMSGSSSSMEGGNSTSGFISRDSSTEQFTDQSGVDLLQFFKDTLNKNPKDRNMLVKIENDLLELAHDKAVEMRFPAMSSYNRMLIHRVAAFFGMEHNVDQVTQQCVIVAPTKATRIPDIRFKTLFRERMTDEPRKSILKRDVHSFDDCRQSYLSCPDRGVLDRKAKSFEEREEEYEKIRRKIFLEGDDEQQQYWHYANNGGNNNDQSAARLRQNNKLLKVQSLPIDRHGGRPSVSKAHSFGGYGGPPQSGGPLLRGDSVNSNKSAGPRLFKQDSVSSTNQSWRLSPSSSGSIYHFDPSNLPPSQAVTSGMYNSNHNNNNNINNTNNNHNKNIGGVPSINRKKHNNNDNNNRQQQRNHNYNNNNNKIQENNIIQYSNSSSSTSSGSNELNCNSIINNVQTISISTSTGTSNNESSIETLSETSSSAQTVVNINQNNNNNNNTSIENESEDIPIITKENINRDMDDIEEEIVSNNYEDNNDKTTLKIDNVQQEKPKFINQATSPNIPTPEPDEISSSITVPVPNEIIKATTKISSINDNQTNNNVTIINASTRSTPITTVSLDIRKDDLKSTNQTNLPIMSYTTSYQTIDGTTVFQPAGSATPYSTTTYQQGPDGSVYAVPQQMVYTYPQQMDGEIQGYFVYDQSAGPRDNSGLIAAPGQTIYQSTPGGAVVPVATYPSQTPYGNGPIYQQQVVYSPEQFSNGAATAAAQMQQYPVTTYPVGYSYPYNGYWGQTMAYYVPQPAIANAVQSSILPPPSLPIVSGTQAIGNGQTQLINPNNNGTPGIIVHGGSSVTAGGKQRNTPPHHHQQQQHHNHHHHHQHHNSHQQQHHQQNLSSGQSSQSTTPATTNTTYQFAAAGLPVAIASDQNGQPMYIPQSAVFPNMLPYGPPNAQSTPAGVLTHLPPQPNTVINPMISHPGGSISSGGPPPLHIPMEQPVPAQHQPPQQQQQSSNYTTISTNSSHGGGSISGNRSCTPQSAPSTPLSNPLPLSAHHQRNNPPLFATPPMIPNGFNSHIVNYQNYAESQQLGGVSSGGGISNYEKKNSYSIGKKTGGGSSNSSGYSSNNRQNSYNSNQQRKTHENPTNTIHNYSGGNTGNTNNSTNTRQIYASQQKKPPSGNSSLSSNNGGGGGGGSNTNLMNSNVNHNNNSNSMSNTSSSAQNNNNTDIKSRPGGIRQKPGNLDFKRNGSQRNSPSTNSTESNNNSPNSIASNHNHMSGSSSGNNSTTGCGPVTDHHHNNHHHHHHQHHQIQHSNQQQQQQYHHSHQQQQQSQTMYMTRGTHIPPMHQSTTAAAVVAAAAAAAANDAAAACHQPLIGAYNHPAPGGMYFKYGQTYFAHPSVALPNNRRSPPNDIRPSLAPLYPTVNMMLPAPRQMQPRHPNPNYKGNKPSR